MSAFHPKLRGSYRPIAVIRLEQISDRMPRGPSLRERLDKATLEKLYNQARLSTVTIAARYGSNSPAVLKLMDEYGIARRSRGAGKS